MGAMIDAAILEQVSELLLCENSGSKGLSFFLESMQTPSFAEHSANRLNNKMAPQCQRAT
jgi:hypothetical protein